MRPPKPGLLISFLLSYLLVLFIPLLISSLALTEAEGLLKSYAIDNSLTLLEQVRDLLDSASEEIKKIGIRIAMDSRVKRLATIREATGEDYYTIWELSRELQAFQFLEESLIIPLLYLPRLDMIVSPSVSCPFSTFYEHHFKYARLSGPEWCRMLLRRYYGGEFLPVASIEFGGNRYSVLTYLQSLPIGYYTPEAEAVIVILVDVARLERMLEKIRLYDHGWASVADAQGRTIVTVAGKKAKPEAVAISSKQATGHVLRRVAGRMMLVIHTVSAKNAWRYAAVVPLEGVMRGVRYVRFLTIGAACLSLLLGIVMAYYLAYRNVKPLREMVRMLTNLFGSGVEKGKTEYDVLRNTLGTIGSIIGDNTLLRQALERQRPLLRAAVFDRLFRGDFSHEPELDNLLTHLGLEIKGEAFTVLIIRLSAFEERPTREGLERFDLIRVLVEEVFTRFGTIYAYIYQIEQDRFTLLLGYRCQDLQVCVQETKAVIEALSLYLWEKYGLKSWFALGGIVNKLTEVYRSYEEARQASSFQQMYEDDICLWYEDIPSGNAKYYYPLELEERLIRQTQLGDKEEIQNIFKEIYQENFVRRKLSITITKQLLKAINNTLYRIMDEELLSLFNNFEEISDNVNINEYYQHLVANFLKACEIIAARRQVSRKELAKRIIKYLESNYTQPDLCLMSVAEEFKLSTTYISQIFKEEIGKNFSDYLEELRLSHACRLLSGTDLSVTEIAAQVGYGSDKAFRRAFKRVKGMSPTDFRKIVHET